MQARLNEFISSRNLMDSSDRVLLAVSGGIDSVVMAHLFAQSDFHCAIAHSNFQLRDDDSEADEQFVRDLAGRLEMPVYVKRFDVPSEMKARGISLQMAARDLRYSWFEELRRDHGYSAIATAHNLDDSVETFLLNLSRGCGIRGLTGIPVRNGKIVRPILFASRADIEDYATLKEIAYREDASNRESKYQRNKIRLDVIPQLKQLNPSFMETMDENMRRLQEIRNIFLQAVERTRKELFRDSPEGIRISVNELLKLEPLGTWIYELFSPYGFTREQCEGIIPLLEAGSGKHSLSPGHLLYKDRDHLILVKAAKEGFERYYLDSPEKPSALPFALDMEVMGRSELGRIPGDRNTACLDYEKVQFPLTIRHWLVGDYFQPLGMEQNKKLSDFFVDEKIPVPEKERIWILASGRKIVWVMGRRIDHRFRISEDTRKVLVLRLQTNIIAEVGEEDL